MLVKVVQPTIFTGHMPGYLDVAKPVHLSPVFVMIVLESCLRGRQEKCYIVSLATYASLLTLGLPYIGVHESFLVGICGTDIGQNPVEKAATQSPAVFRISSVK